MKQKAKLRAYIDANPKSWIRTPTSKIAEATDISRAYVDDLLCIVAAQKFADKMPSEYKEMRRISLKNQSKLGRIKMMLLRNSKIEDIALTVGTSPAYVRTVKSEMKQN